jgi:hypothetical protein
MKKLCKILDKRTSEDPSLLCERASRATLAIMSRNIRLLSASVSSFDVSLKNVSLQQINLTALSWRQFHFDPCATELM